MIMCDRCMDRDSSMPRMIVIDLTIEGCGTKTFLRKHLCANCCEDLDAALKTTIERVIKRLPGDPQELNPVDSPAAPG